MLAIIALNTGKPDYELAILKNWFSEVIPLTGMYKGVLEDSYMVNLNDPTTGWGDGSLTASLRKIKTIGKTWEQESILFVKDNEDYNASLLYLKEENEENIGTFVSIYDITGLESWSQDKKTGQYYAVI